MRYAIRTKPSKAQIKRESTIINSAESNAILARLFLTERRILFIIPEFYKRQWPFARNGISIGERQYG